MDNEYFIERLSGRFKIHRKGTNGSKCEQIATADSEEDAILITGALNERERLREALRQMRAMFFESHPAHPWIPGARAPEAIAIIDAALNEQKGE